ncbi:MAG: DUF2254 domain-containing protein [Paracoccaceae bacterium]
MKLISQGWFRLRRIGRQLWVRTSAYAFLALFTAIGSRLVSPFIPDFLVSGIETDAVLSILGVVSSSMLAVTTFSLAVLVSARQSIATNITPRAHHLAAEDKVTQKVLSTFMGAFIYALTAQVLIRTGLYDARAAAVILFVSIVVIGLVVIAILRWIDHLSDLGSITETVAEIERACKPALLAWRSYPALGAQPLDEGSPLPDDAIGTVKSDFSGYVQHIDVARLNEFAEARGDSQIFVFAEVGHLVTAGETLCRFSGDPDPSDLRGAFSFGTTRSFDQDPRYGLIVLSEIAQRALSPAVNDPGTAIFILGRILALLTGDGTPREISDPACQRVFMAPVTPHELLRDGFSPIARDGAGMVEVQIRLQKTLAKLAAQGDPEMAEAAAEEAARAFALAGGALALKQDRDLIRDLAAKAGANMDADG